MRFSVFAAVATLGSTALAQSIPGLPSCAATCFGNNLGSCGPLDIACICGNAPVINSVSCCVFATCSSADTQTTITFAVNFCKAANVNVNTSPSCPSGSSTAASGSGSRSTSASAASSVSGSMTAMVSGASGSASRSTTPTASAAGSSGAAPAPTAGGFGMGLAGALAGLLAQAVL